MFNILKHYAINIYILEINIDDTQRLEATNLNNVNLYDKEHNKLWNIKELLVEYSNNNNIKYHDELFFDVRILDDNTFKLSGFYNHCIVSIETMKIIKLVNNR